MSFPFPVAEVILLVLSDQLMPLVGVAVGAMVSFVATAVGERMRFAREFRIRWDQRELDAYVEYVGAVVVMARIAGQVAAHRGYDDLAARVDEVAGLGRLDEAEAQRTVAFERVVLLGDARTIEAAHELNRAVWRLEWLARGATEGSPAEWGNCRDRYLDALGAFHDAARKGISVPGGFVQRRLVARPVDAEAPVPKAPAGD